MGRGRVQLRRIENKINRQVTFSKRRYGLMKKASELSILCDAEVALIVFSNRGKLYEFSSSSMTKILERHKKFSNTSPNTSRDIENSQLELTKLKARNEHLQKWKRHLSGEDLDSMTIEELQLFENQLEEGLKHVRLRKTQFMFDLIQQLRRKELVEEINKSLHKKKLQCPQVEGQYLCEHDPIQVLGTTGHSVPRKYTSGFSSKEVDTHGHSQPTQYMGFFTDLARNGTSGVGHEGA